jgi:serine phosphatase RsbU (regulator of sigma subunit)
VKDLKIYFLLLFLFLTGITLAQDAYVDSLKQVLRDLPADSLRVNTLNDIAAAIYGSDPDEAIRYSREAKELAERISFRRGEALAYKNIGLGHYFRAEFSESARSWESSLVIYEELGDDQMVANLLSNLGAIYHSIGKNVEALELYLRALKMAEELSDSLRIGTLTINIGVVYSEMPATLDTAVNYYMRAIKIGEAIGDQDIMGLGAMDLGEVYMEKEELDSALYYFEKSLTQMTSPIHISSALNFIGSIYSEREDFQTAITYQEDALELARKENAQRETVGILMGLASTYEGMGNPGKTIEYFKQAESIAEEIGLNEELSGIYEGLATNYAEVQDFPNAYRCLELQNTIDNAIYRLQSDDRTKDLMNNYQMEKKQDEIALLEQQAEIDRLLRKRQRAVSIVIGLFGLFILAAAVGFYNRMRFIRKTNEKINAQKEQITDSITYAQRIQSAILPSEEVMKEQLPDHFILYRPKDIVSGDFYWVKEVQDHLVIVAADCTGHGVPGAFMSMLGITMFNDLISDRCFDAPGAILDRLRDKVKEMLEQKGDGDEQKDGMDLAIAVLNKNNRELHFSGANNPLYIIRKKDQADQKDLLPFASIDNGDYSLFEIKGDKQPIGTHWEETPFRTTSVYLQEQDSFYMFSDGFIDQFGGENRKKFKSMNFKKLLLSLQKESMDLQREKIEQTFDQWRGPYEQLDDIIVLGVKV